MINSNHAKRLGMAGIIVRDVGLVYTDARTGGDLEVLGSLSFEVENGKMVCVLGISGCGKTTLLNLIAGLQKPTKGEVIFTETANPTNHITNTVFQEPSLFPWRTVLSNTTFGLEMRGVDKQEARSRAMKYLKMTGLAGFENHYPHQLSGGMKQRVAIARALTNDPEVLLMDEPFASVDAQTRWIMQDQLIEIQAATKKTILLVTHNIEEAIFLADKMIVLTAKPSRVKKVIAVRLPRPRTWDTRSTPEFLETYKLTMALLKEELANAGNLSTNVPVR